MERKKTNKAMYVVTDRDGLHTGQQDMKGISGWVSPAYTQSRQVIVDPHQLLRNRCACYQSGTYEAGTYDVLRTQVLQRTGRKGGTTLMITSALPGEGKTLTAINLSLAIAREFELTVLLVDGDLRKPTVHEYLGFDMEMGLADYLIAGAPLSELIVWPGLEKMTILPGGKTVQAGSELVSSPRMQELVKDLKHRYPDRYVVFDAPPVLGGADALALAPQVDYIVMVVRAGANSSDDVKRALALLPQDKVLGVVLNRAEPSHAGKEYGYGVKKRGKLLRTGG